MATYKNGRLQDLQTLLQALTTEVDTEYRSLIISIDLGTTFSGVGYIFTSAPENFYTVTRWPGTASRKTVSPKVPTVLRYGSGGPGFNWGYQVGRRDTKKIEAFKLLLDSTLPNPSYTQVKVQNNLREFAKTPVDAVNDFIGALYGYAIEHIEETHSHEYSDILAVKFVVSTPAGWPETAKTIILDAARRAVGDSVIHMTEAEAAARFAMQSNEAKPVVLKAGNTIMICDAGGATANLSSCTIRKLSPLELVQLVPPLSNSNLGSASCVLAYRSLASAGGSLDLDKKFEDHIIRNLQEAESIPMRKSPLFADTLDQFDQTVKQAFTSSNTIGYSIQLKGARLTDDPSCGLRNNTMILQTRDLEMIFRPVATSVANAIQEQINAVKEKKLEVNRLDKTSVDAIILVGGFGGNKYLREHLGLKFPQMKFIQPVNAWTAVIRGAAVRHAPTQRLQNIPLPPQIPRAKTASMHYGVAYSPKWNQSVHSHAGKYWDDWEGVWRCKTIKWIVKKGDDLRRPRREVLRCYKQCSPRPEDNEDLFIKANLEQSAALEPPTNSSDGSITTKKLIRVPIDTISDTLFHKKTRPSDGVEYWELVYDIILEVNDGTVGFCVEVNGEQFGRD